MYMHVMYAFSTYTIYLARLAEYLLLEKNDSFVEKALNKRYYSFAIVCHAFITTVQGSVVFIIIVP